MGTPWPRLRRSMGQEVDRGEIGEGLKASFPSQLDCPEGPHQQEPQKRLQANSTALPNPRYRRTGEHLGLYCPLHVPVLLNLGNWEDCLEPA